MRPCRHLPIMFLSSSCHVLVVLPAMDKKKTGRWQECVLFENTMNLMPCGDCPNSQYSLSGAYILQLGSEESKRFVTASSGDIFPYFRAFESEKTAILSII